MIVKEVYSSLLEYNPAFRDRFDRVSSHFSTQKSLSPFLSKLLIDKGFKPKYPDNKKFAICLSHDIDYLYEYKSKHIFGFSFAKNIIIKNFKQATYNFENIFGKSINPNWHLDRLIKFEEDYKVKSTYYFLSLKPGESDFNYHVESLQPTYDYLLNNNYEIGLHGGHEAYCSKQKIKQELQSLQPYIQQKIIGYRNHYLRFSTPNTWKYLSEIGFEYDTTYGFADMCGYRNGMCFPFRPFDFNTNEYINILEFPLIVMDVNFFKYMNLTVSTAFNLFEKIMNDIKVIGGVLTICWHNNCIDEQYGELYHLIMQKIVSDNDAHITTIKEMNNWWKMHNLSAMEQTLEDIFQTEIII